MNIEPRLPLLHLGAKELIEILNRYYASQGVTIVHLVATDLHSCRANYSKEEALLGGLSFTCKHESQA